MQSRRGEAPGGGVSRVEQVLRHERGVTGAGLAVLTLLAWWYVWTGAGTGMPATAMTALALFPHLTMEMGGMTTAAPVGWAMALVMWWVMMIAMMTPSAAPLVLLYGRVLRHHCAQADDGAAVASSFYLVGGYLTAWLALQPADLTSATMLWSKSAVLSATVLLAAGLYQLSPLKSACLRQCRGPAAFLTRYWRPGRLGAFAMGVRHGAWCVGCCWMLMALLFVGGIMNLVWIAAIALLVLAEKLAPAGPAVSKVTGVVLLAWGVSTLLV
jgi:predicted metal-binding membrane protein